MGKTILLVDHEMDTLDIKKRYLVQAGYQVLVARDGVEGLDLFRKNSVDLIITDIMMPNMDGYDFISEVQYIQYLINLFFLQRLRPASKKKFMA